MADHRARREHVTDAIGVEAKTLPTVRFQKRRAKTRHDHLEETP